VPVAGRHFAGRINCRPAYKDCVIADCPRNAGFSRTSTRRTASCAVMASPARIRKGRTSSYFHRAGTQGVAGWGGTSACSTSHRGVRLSASMSQYSCLRSRAVGWGAFMNISFRQGPYQPRPR
jgi:hypothetical protein